MGRPLKKGLDYFPFDVEFWSDSRIRILKSRYHSDGIGIYIHVLCDIYREGYYFKVDNYEDYLCVLNDDLGIESIDKVEQILTFICNRSLLVCFRKETTSKGLQEDAVFTSHGIQKRYVAAMKGRKKSISDIRGDYWLLSEEDEAELSAFYKSGQNDSNSENKGSNSEKNSDNSEKNSTNKNKGNEIKTDENKKEDIISIIAYLNSVCGTSYKPTVSDTIELITDKLRSGFIVSDFKLVIDKKAKEWMGTDYQKFLRPSTLFGDKFEAYLNQPDGIVSSSRAGVRNLEKEWGETLNSMNNGVSSAVSGKRGVLDKWRSTLDKYSTEENEDF